jgi:magnesium transporter
MLYHYQTTADKLIRCQELIPNSWTHIAPPLNMFELERLSEKLNIPLDFFTDSLDIDERSRIEIEDDIKLLVINSPILNEAVSQEPTLYITVPMGIIICPHYLITISSYPNAAIDAFRENKHKCFNYSNHSLFILKILEQNVIEYLRSLKDINVRRNTIEQEIYETSRNQDLMKFLNLEKSLVYFATSLSSTAMMLVKLKRNDLLHIKYNEDLSDLLEDIIIDNNQAQEMANLYAKILGETSDALSAMIANKLNIVIQRLTLVTLLLMLPTLVASFYGMNVPLPFQDHPYSFYFIIGIVLILTTILVFIFRKTKLF